jgi:hypothetical protein
MRPLSRNGSGGNRREVEPIGSELGVSWSSKPRF